MDDTVKIVAIAGITMISLVMFWTFFIPCAGILAIYFILEN